MEAIHEIAEAMPNVDADLVLGELADFRSKEKKIGRQFVQKSAAKSSPTSWWNGICCSTQLSKVSANILNLPPTSAAVERSFSRHSFIHSAKRNRLTTDRAAKLVFIGHNLTLGTVDEASAEKFVKEAQADSAQCQPSTSRTSPAAGSSRLDEIANASESDDSLNYSISLQDISDEVEMKSESDSDINVI